MYKCCVIIYHKNALSLYKPEWIKACLQSLNNQTFQNFDIFELNYGDDKSSIMDIFNINKQRYFWKIPMDNHAQAMNFLLTMAFEKYNYDFVFNVNIDDYYDENRFKIQIKYFDTCSFEICSSNYKINNWPTIQMIDFVKSIESNVFIKKYLDSNHNIICHPSVCFYKTFWKKTPEICYYDEIPQEDLKLWQRCLKENIKMVIIPEYLTVYRKHPNQITQKNISLNKE